MTLPDFSSPVDGAGIDVPAFDAALNAMFDELHDVLGAIVTGLNPRGSWAASSPFPANAAKGDFWFVDEAGTVDGQTFAVGDWLIALVANASTATFAGNWTRGDYSKVVRQVYENATDLLASLEASRGPGALWQTQDGHAYKEAAATATDHHLTTAGGVKLYVRPNPQGYSLLAFGALGNGATNDHAAVVKALEVASGSILDGRGRTYRIHSPIVCASENITVRNMTLDFSDVPDQVPSTIEPILTFAGSMGAATALTTNHSDGAHVMYVASTAGFEVDGYAWLTSTAMWETSQNVVLGQMVYVKSIDSTTQLTLHTKILYSFATADSATLAPLNMKRDIRFDRVNFIGAGANHQSMLDFAMCRDVEITGCSFDFCDYAAVRVSRCANIMADNVSIRRARSAGLAYGFQIGNGCYGVKVANSYGEEMRHFVTVGDNDGVNLFVTVSNCNVRGCLDAGIDAHAACDFMVVDGNTIEGSAFDGGQQDGIIFQGLNWVCSNNIVVGIRRHNLFHHVLPNIGIGSSIITGNQVRNGGGASGAKGVQVLVQGGGSFLTGLNVSDNLIGGSFVDDIRIRALSGSIYNLSVSANVCDNVADVYGCLVMADAGQAIENFTVTGNVLRSSGDACLCFLGSGLNIQNGAVSGNVILGSAIYGIRYVETAKVEQTGNRIAATLRKTLISSPSNQVNMDRRGSMPVSVTASSYTVADDDEAILVSFEGTCTLILPSAVDHPGRRLEVKTIQAQAVNSASANVAPIDAATAGISILPAADGAWAVLRSNGAEWVTMQKG